MSVGVCESVSLLLLLLLLSFMEASEPPRDVGHGCLEGETKCLMADLEIGCCPFEKAVCCQDKVHCCPNVTVCDLNLHMCTHVEMATLEERPRPILPLPIRSLTSSCGPGQQHCGGDTCCELTDTCCPGPGGHGWLCCVDRIQATCCPDGRHCCYRDFECVGNPPVCKPRPIATRQWYT